MLIYVAGPLSGKDGHEGTYSNIVRAVQVAEQLYDKGHWAYIPHLSTFQHRIIKRLKPNYTPTYERWLAYDFEVIGRCDALFYIAPSPGADREKKYAEAMGIPVYTNIDDVPKSWMVSAAQRTIRVFQFEKKEWGTGSGFDRVGEE